LSTYSLRPANSGDLELTYEITRDAMREYVIQTWGAWNEDEQREKHLQNYTPSTYRIVLRDGEGIGLVAVEDETDHLWLVKIYLLKSRRRFGIGTSLLQQVINEAEQLHKPVRLRVLRVNQDAQRLYLRHGFAVVGEEPERLFMVRRASGA
jgi:GNAT superfamily N-acetyltransferase